MPMDLVSIIVPSYNRSNLIRRCYDSVVKQGHRPLEFLLADDASTDDTEAVVRGLPPAEGVTISYLRQPINRGVSAARNLAIRAAQGRYLAFLDSDDVWFPNHLETLLPVFSSTGADIVYARGDIRESPESPHSGRSDFGPLDYERDHVASCLYFYNFVLPSVTAVKREFIEQVGFFDEDPDIQHAEDWDIFLRAAQAGLKFAHVEKATGFYIVPDQFPPHKRLMMMRRSIHCLIKHRGYPLTPTAHKHLCLNYYQLWLGAMVLPTDQDEAGNLFRRVWADSWPSLRIAGASLAGLIGVSGVPVIAGLSQRIFYRLLRKIHVEYRTLRGFPDPED